MMNCTVAFKYMHAEMTIGHFKVGLVVTIGQIKPCSHISLQEGRETQFYHVLRRGRQRNRLADSTHYHRRSPASLHTAAKTVFLKEQSDTFSCLNPWGKSQLIKKKL